ncbi:hypothetical protein JQX13_18270 [Archangium violaceum]|uniref:hypothetical protein n=1 Tax=Archangium violaceum TaxID=83451 RepID=UPI00193B2CCA|nr:hypothetical protein [Archangium violaceum]QRK14265.1 hypothetical protein JQX13_18270 [Archangium violaceum]
MRTRIGALVLAVVAGLAGCGTSPPPEECGQKQLTDGQGSVYRCIASEDCPRSSGVTLCVSDTDVLDACIRCLDTECVRVFPEAC